MSTNKSTMQKIVRYLSFLSFALLISANIMYAQTPLQETIPPQEPVKEKSKIDDIFVVVEVQPEYPGGMQALMSFLSENIIYPLEAIRNGVEGRVITSFIVNKDGSVSDIEVIRSVDSLLNAEAIRVIGMMPKWNPGKQKGEAVNVRFTMPVAFRLNKNKTANDESIDQLRERIPDIIKGKLGSNSPLIIVDGKKMPRGFDIEQIKPEDIKSTSFIEPQTAISTYADEGKNGVLLITTKKGPTLYNVNEMNDLYEKGEKARLELKEKGEKARIELKEKGEKAREELKEKSGITVYD